MNNVRIPNVLFYVSLHIFFCLCLAVSNILSHSIYLCGQSGANKKAIVAMAVLKLYFQGRSPKTVSFRFNPLFKIDKFILCYSVYSNPLEIISEFI